jgi:uncharacterized protein HemX
MDTQLMLAMVVAALAGGAAGAGGAWWWQSRSVRALQARLAQSEQSRATVTERARQARAQITQLQQDLATVKAELAAKEKAADRADGGRHRREQLSRTLDDQATLVLPRPELPADGFAETQPFV